MVTYGWAFLIILAAIGALSYFGFLTPSKYIPASCDFGEQLNCEGSLIRDTGIVTFRFENNFEADIVIISVFGVGHTASNLNPDADLLGFPLVVTIPRGEIRQVHYRATGPSFNKGDNERLETIFTFERLGGSILHNVSGVFRTEVIDSVLS